MKGIRIGIVTLGLILLGFIIFKKPFEVPAKTEPTQAKKIIPQNPHIVSFLDTLDNHIEAFVNRSKVPGVAVVAVYQGRTIYKKAFGVKERNTIQPVDTNTVFRLASVSKGFASTLAGILINDSLLSWDGKVKEYLPLFSLKTKSQTDVLELQHLLSHTSGLQYQAYTNLVEEGLDRDEIIERLREVDLISNVGELYSYQNVAYSIIEPIIERATNDTYKEVMEREIFEALNMNNASLTYESFNELDNKAKPHIYRGNRRYRSIKISPTYYNVAAAGGVNASISDMEEWLKAMLGHKPEVVPLHVLNKLFTPYVRTSLKERAFRRINKPVKAHYGMGWRIVHLPQDTIVYHGGYANGYRSGVAFSPKYDIGICILTNSSYDLPGEAMADFFDLFYPRADSIKPWRYKYVF